MSNRHFLVIVDGTKEMEVALNYACNRAKKTDGNLILASFISKILILSNNSPADISVSIFLDSFDIFYVKLIY